MDFISLFSASLAVLSLLIWAMTMGGRKAVEYFWKGAKNNKFWNEMVLPLSPLGIGGLFGILFPMYPWPTEFGTSAVARFAVGVVCGLVSAHAYKILKKMLAKKEADAGPDSGTDLLSSGEEKKE